jgi:hypothetical protein
MSCAFRCCDKTLFRWGEQVIIHCMYHFLSDVLRTARLTDLKGPFQIEICEGTCLRRHRSAVDDLLLFFF